MRIKMKEKTVSQSPATLYYQHLSVTQQLSIKKVRKRKTGSKDQASDWAKARVQRCLMTQEMLQAGEDIDRGETTMKKIREKDMLPLYLDGIVFADQSHMRAVPTGGTGQNGSMSEYQYMVAVNKENGSLDEFGVVPEEREQVKPKYDSYAQGCYAVCAPDNMPQFLPTFDYTGKQLTSAKSGKRNIEEEMKRAREAVGGGWKNFNQINPYLQRYGTQEEQENDPTMLLSNDPKLMYEVTTHVWYKEMKKKMQSVPVCDFLLHLIHHCERTYSNTLRQNTYMIWHDRLSILWEKETQAWLANLKCPITGWLEQTWADRFVRLRGEYNGKVSKYYQNSLPGDSPELMPLDCHLFNDIKEGTLCNVAFSFFLEDDDN
jgi:hypothetical protein